MNAIAIFTIFVSLTVIVALGDEFDSASSLNVSGHILGGEPIEGINFRARVQISARRACAGVIVHRRFVATASHCFKNGHTPTPDVDISQMIVYAPMITRRDASERSWKKAYKVKHVYVPKQRKRNRHGVHDIALVEMVKDFGEDCDIAPFPTHDDPLPKHNETMYIIAFNHDMWDDLNSTLYRAAFHNKNRKEFIAEGYHFPEKYDGLILKATGLGFPNTVITGTCKGDSGTGYLRLLEDGTYMHMGVHSGGNAGCRNPRKVSNIASSFHYIDAFRRLLDGDDSDWGMGYDHGALPPVSATFTPSP